MLNFSFLLFYDVFGFMLFHYIQFLIKSSCIPVALIVKKNKQTHFHKQKGKLKNFSPWMMMCFYQVGDEDSYSRSLGYHDIESQLFPLPQLPFLSRIIFQEHAPHKDLALRCLLTFYSQGIHTNTTCLKNSVTFNLPVVNL